MHLTYQKTLRIQGKFIVGLLNVMRVGAHMCGLDPAVD